MYVKLMFKSWTGHEFIIIWFLFLLYRTRGDGIGIPYGIRSSQSREHLMVPLGDVKRIHQKNHWKSLIWTNIWQCANIRQLSLHIVPDQISNQLRINFKKLQKSNHLFKNKCHFTFYSNLSSLQSIKKLHFKSSEKCQQSRFWWWHWVLMCCRNILQII